MRWLTDKFSRTKSKASAKKGGPRKTAAGAAKGRKQVRRRNQPKWRKPLMIGASMSLLFGLTVGGSAWLWTSGIISETWNDTMDGLHEASIDSGLFIREVYVVNRQRTSRKAILRALNVQIGDSILDFDPETARRDIEALGWVRTATVERRMPDRIVVQVEERKPAAIWQKHDQYFLVDLEGALISQRDVKLFPDLKVITGDDAPKHTAQLLQVLAQAPQLEKQVVGAVWVGNRRWNIQLENDVSVRLPEQDPHAAWKRLSVLIKEHELLNREIRAIDMRQPDRLVIRMTDVGAQRLMAPEEDT
ncbi:cell division protein FtsQ/DivIB [Aestuariispira insulae]|uniref:Cell division protein FtsQ n=1 Tax=Aestuariispira insulae TaxID=1461337 RepID=A0A3D9HX92_9PROT|nr:cell division protein FtsQ/DivIB [Aestuariispira insulae]RED54118.1 cell division protein FtsQ [Aestuariispira insulae]